MKYNRYKKEIAIIADFRESFIAFTRLDRERYPTNEQTAKLFELREKLNKLNCEVALYVHKAGISASITYTPAPMIGGYIRNIDIFANLFNLDTYEIAPQTVIDSLDRALGNYAVYNKKFIRRIINPFHWVGELIRIPFYLLRWAGFDSMKIETSLPGKLYKFILSFILYCSAFLQILNFIGVDTKISFLEHKTKSTQNSQLKDTNPTAVDKSHGQPSK